MALRGTLKDFGIADIFQLIGHQGKSGQLTVKNRDQHVTIDFYDGNVVRARPNTREAKDLLGSMLVRGEVITQPQLDKALEVQRATLKRLGDILCDQNAIEPDVLQTFTKLQTGETIYRLFVWDAGTYEFDNVEVKPPDRPGEMLRSENVLMEGFRQVDVWPEIRKHITSYGLTFRKLEDLDDLIARESTQAAPAAEDDFGDLDAAFGDFDGGGSSSSRLRDIGDNERLLYALIVPERDVQKIADLSRLGEFETCKALCNLIAAGIIETVPEEANRRPSAPAIVGGISPPKRNERLTMGMQGLLLVAVLISAFLGVRSLDLDASALWRIGEQGHMNTSIQQLLSRAQILRLHEALAIYQAQRGTYPPGLQNLVEQGLVTEDDLHFPWRREYNYAPRDDGYVLVRPFY